MSHREEPQSPEETSQRDEPHQRTRWQGSWQTIGNTPTDPDATLKQLLQVQWAATQQTETANQPNWRFQLLFWETANRTENTGVYCAFSVLMKTNKWRELSLFGSIPGNNWIMSDSIRTGKEDRSHTENQWATHTETTARQCVPRKACTHTSDLHSSRNHSNLNLIKIRLPQTQKKV